MTTIAHPTNASSDEHLAFAHATALARRAGARLVSVHAGDDPSFAARMPDAGALLSRWGDDGGLTYERLVADCCLEDTSDAVLDALRGLAPDLIVAATHDRGPIARILNESYAEGIANNLRVPSLLLRTDVKGFVDEASGSIDLRRVLVPIGDAEEAAQAVERAAWILDMAGAEQAEIHLLRVGAPTEWPETPERPGWTWIRRTVDAPLEAALAKEAEGVSLVVMATRGHDSVGDVIAGSHTERVLRSSRCPVLSVPVA